MKIINNYSQIFCLLFSTTKNFKYKMSIYIFLYVNKTCFTTYYIYILYAYTIELFFLYNSISHNSFSYTCPKLNYTCLKIIFLQ